MSTKMSVRYGTRAVPITETLDDDGVVVFLVKNEDDKEISRDSFDVYDLGDANVHRTMLYGLNKLLTDRTSDQKDKLHKLVEMRKVFDLLVSGEWAKERAVGAVVVSPEVEALAAMQTMSIPDTQAALAQYDKDVRKAILGREDVISHAKVIRKARESAPAKTLDDLIPTN